MCGAIELNRCFCSLVLVGPPIEIKVTAAVKNVKEKSLRSLFALLERFGSEQPM